MSTEMYTLKIHPVCKASRIIIFDRPYPETNMSSKEGLQVQVIRNVSYLMNKINAPHNYERTITYEYTY